MDPFGKPSSASGIDWKTLHQRLLLIKPKGFEPAISTVHGETSAVQADVVVLDGPEAGTEYADTLVFPKVLQSQIKPQIGGMVLGRLGQGQAKKGQSAPWELAEFSDADAQLARDYIAKTSPAPF